MGMCLAANRSSCLFSALQHGFGISNYALLAGPSNPRQKKQTRNAFVQADGQPNPAKTPESVDSG